jgi:hypothetical protein
MAAITRNLYREDEVLAALRMSILMGRYDETVFWAQEALDSAMLQPVYQSLFLAWIYGFGPSYPEWLVRLRAAVQQGPQIKHETVLELALLLCKHAKTKADTTVVALLGLGIEPLRGHLGPTVVHETELISTANHKNFAAAIIQGRPVIALQCSRLEWGTTYWDILAKLRTANKEVVYLLQNGASWAPAWWRAEYTWPCIAAAIALTASKQTLSAKEDSVKPELIAIRNRWIFEPQRFRRAFSPPLTCLYWFTRRGALRVNETTEADLMESLELCLETSRFWGPLMPQTDEEREAFYDRYFVTDIPDEWAQEERLVSHGTGVVPVGDHINTGILFTRCLDRWFGYAPSKWVWAGTEDGLAVLKKEWVETQPASFEDGIHALYSSPTRKDHWRRQVAQWDPQYATVRCRV